MLKKNGAHNHLSQLKKLRASKYSRHVVLCKYSHHQTKRIHKQVLERLRCFDFVLFHFDNHFQREKYTFIQKNEENKVNSKLQIMEKR